MHSILLGRMVAGNTGNHQPAEAWRLTTNSKEQKAISAHLLLMISGAAPLKRKLSAMLTSAAQECGMSGQAPSRKPDCRDAGAYVQSTNETQPRTIV